MKTKKLKLKKGTEIDIIIPFNYTIGYKGPRTNKVLETTEDCVNEMKAEIDEGLNSGNLHYIVT